MRIVLEVHIRMPQTMRDNPLNTNTVREIIQDIEVLLRERKAFAEYVRWEVEA